MKFHKIFLVVDSSYYTNVITSFITRTTVTWNLLVVAVWVITTNVMTFLLQLSSQNLKGSFCLLWWCDYIVKSKVRKFHGIFPAVPVRIITNVMTYWLQSQSQSWNCTKLINHVITYLLPKILNLPSCCCSGYYYQHNIHVYYKGKLRSQNFKESSCCLPLLSVMTHLLQRQNEGHEISLNLSGCFCSSLTNRIFIKENQGHETLQNLSRFYTEMLFQLLLPTLFTHLLQRMTLVELQFNF